MASTGETPSLRSGVGTGWRPRSTGCAGRKRAAPVGGSEPGGSRVNRLRRDRGVRPWACLVRPKADACSHHRQPIPAPHPGTALPHMTPAPTRRHMAPLACQRNGAQARLPARPPTTHKEGRPAIGHRSRPRHPARPRLLFSSGFPLKHDVTHNLHAACKPTTRHLQAIIAIKKGESG